MSVETLKKTPSGRCQVSINMRLDGCTPIECIQETLALIRILSESIEIHAELLESGLESAGVAAGQSMEKES